MNKKDSWDVESVNFLIIIVIVLSTSLIIVLLVWSYQENKLSKDNDILWSSLSECKNELAYCQNLMDKILEVPKLQITTKAPEPILYIPSFPANCPEQQETKPIFNLKREIDRYQCVRVVFPLPRTNATEVKDYSSYGS